MYSLTFAQPLMQRVYNGGIRFGRGVVDEKGGAENKHSLRLP